MRSAAEFEGDPWLSVRLGQIEGIGDVPTMLARPEQKLYYWLTSKWIKGLGDIVDVGCFVGGSTARFAAGLVESGHQMTVHGYDRFTVKAGVKERQLYRHGVPHFHGQNIFPVAKRLLAPWEHWIKLHRGNIEDLGWSGGKIEVLALDASKKADLTDKMTADFFPALIPGQSVVIQQDFLHWSQPWIAAQMVAFGDCFEPVAYAPNDTIVYLCKREITPGDIELARVGALSDEQIIFALRETRMQLARFNVNDRLERMEAALRHNPGVRVAWQMKAPD